MCSIKCSNASKVAACYVCTKDFENKVCTDYCALAENTNDPACKKENAYGDEQEPEAPEQEESTPEETAPENPAPTEPATEDPTPEE